MKPADASFNATACGNRADANVELPLHFNSMCGGRKQADDQGWLDPARSSDYRKRKHGAVAGGRADPEDLLQPLLYVATAVEDLTTLPDGGKRYPSRSMLCFGPRLPSGSC